MEKVTYREKPPALASPHATLTGQQRITPRRVRHKSRTLRWIQLAEISLIRVAFALSLLFSAPSLLLVANIPTVALTRKLLAGQGLPDLKTGTFVFSLLGAVALSSSVANATFTYAASTRHKEIARLLRWAAKSLYACMMTMLAMMTIPFAMRVYEITFSLDNSKMWISQFRSEVNLVGMFLTTMCTILAILKLIQFCIGVFQAMFKEAKEW